MRTRVALRVSALLCAGIAGAAALLVPHGAGPRRTAVAQEPSTEPMIYDSGFEAGLEGWQQQGEAEFAVDTEGPHGGRQSARIVVPPGAQLQYQQLHHVLAPVASGDEFRVTLWVRSAGVTDGTGAYAALQFLDAAGQRVGIVHSKVAVTNGAAGWEQLTMEGRAPKGTTQGQVDLILHAHGTAWFVDVQVTQTGRLEPWPDLGAAERQITVRAGDVVQPHFGGVGFHAFHHIFPVTQPEFDEVIAKRWRELRPPFARLNHSMQWDQAMLDQTARHLRLMQQTGTEVYLTTWDPPDTQPGEERRAYAREVVDDLEYLVRRQGATNIRWYCMTNELSLNGWGALAGDLPKFADYHRALCEELQRRDLDLKLLATDASPVDYWPTIEWATGNMDDITGVYGGHHYINDYALDDERFYPWFLARLEWGVGLARGKGKEFIIGEFGSKQDGSMRNGKRWDACVYWDTPQEPLVAIQVSEAVIAALNAGVYALGYWTFADFPDDYSQTYANKWGVIKWREQGFATRPHYYAYALLTRYFPHDGAVLRAETSDPYLRVAAMRGPDEGSTSVAVVSRYAGEVPVAISLPGAAPARPFRKHVYDASRPPSHPFGDLPEPDATLTVGDGVLRDTVAQNTLTVYTTHYDNDPPPPVEGLAVTAGLDGKPRVTWEPSPAGDLCYYRVYASREAGFEPGVANQTGSTVATELTHAAAETGAQYHYAVVAVDDSGNASSSR